MVEHPTPPDFLPRPPKPPQPPSPPQPPDRAKVTPEDLQTLLLDDLNRRMEQVAKLLTPPRTLQTIWESREISDATNLIDLSSPGSIDELVVVSSSNSFDLIVSWDHRRFVKKYTELVGLGGDLGSISAYERYQDGAAQSEYLVHLNGWGFRDFIQIDLVPRVGTLTIQRLFIKYTTRG